MKIGLASDHAGFPLKKGVIVYLQENGIAYFDYGSAEGEKVDYVDFAERAIVGYQAGECDRLILVCGTGIGMTMVANKFKGIRATLCCDEYMAEMSRAHNDSNCLTIGGRILPVDEGVFIVKTWVETEYEGGRHQARLDKIAKIEDQNFKA